MQDKNFIIKFTKCTCLCTSLLIALTSTPVNAGNDKKEKGGRLGKVSPVVSEKEETSTVVLPDELWLNIFSQSNLSPQERMGLGGVCKNFHTLVRDKDAWPAEDIAFCQKHYGKNPWEIDLSEASQTLRIQVNSSKLETLIPYAHLIWNLTLVNSDVDPATPDTIKLLQCFPNLIELDLWTMDLTSLCRQQVPEYPQMIQDIAQNCPNLMKLSLTVSTVTDADLKVIARCCPDLSKLNLLSTQVTDEGIRYIAKGCRNLTSLDLSNCQNITDKCIKFLAKDSPELFELRINGTPITSFGLKHLKQLYNLQKLVLPKDARVLEGEKLEEYMNSLPGTVKKRKQKARGKSQQHKRCTIQ